MLFIITQLIKKPLSCFLLFIVFSVFITSCKKDSFITSPGASINLSTDTLKYDTVFTNTGSITQSFKINNTNSQKLLLSSVKLMGGTSSPFTINVNGIAAQEVKNIEVAANDSIYVFVTVNINPSSANLPFIVRDSILVNYNGNDKFVQLEAFGQNAHFLRNTKITANTNWTDDLPYVILGGIQIDTNIILTIDAGCKIYSHADAPILIDGSLIINGSKSKPVVFASDRLDEDYRDFPASWPGLYFRGTSKNNVLRFTTIKNAYQAIVTQSPSGNSNPKVVLHQCIIDNAYDAGLLGVNSSLYADNTLISNCGTNVYFILGGNYNLTNCTVASYSAFINHKKPVLTANNFAMINGSQVTADLVAVFKNCIFWSEEGYVKDEVDIKKDGNNVFNVLFDHCLYKSTTDPANSTISNSILNQDPLFDSINVSRNYFDFHTSSTNAPGIDKGTSTTFPKDLDDNNRSNGFPDLGCYEKQ